MKKLFSSLLLLIAVVCYASESRFKSDDGVIGHWVFNGNIEDLGTNGLSGKSTTVEFVDSDHGKAMKGVASIGISGNSGFEKLVGNFTFKVLFKVNELTEDQQAIFWKRGGKPHHGFLLQILSNKLLFCFYDTKGKQYHLYGPKLTKVDLHKWIELVVSYNGVELDMSINNRSVATKKLENIVIDPGKVSLYIGSAGKKRIFHGEIDELLITTSVDLKRWDDPKALMTRGVESLKSSGFHEINYLCSSDNSMQSAMWFAPVDQEKSVPLLVGLHTWGGDYKQSSGKSYFKLAKKRGWVIIFPNFRGPNKTPDGMCSDKAVRDIVDAVEYAKKHANIDAKRIYLCGASGGGLMAMMMAGRNPEIWAGVSAWCGISDIQEWHAYNKNKKRGYYKNIERALGGDPNTDEIAAVKAVRRSPVTWLKNAKGVPLDIYGGLKDISVPPIHSEKGFDAVVGIKVPWDSNYSNKVGGFKIVKRKTLQNARLTIFDGGHTIVYNAAIDWLSHQRKGDPVVWKGGEKATGGTEIQK